MRSTSPFRRRLLGSLALLATSLPLSVSAQSAKAPFDPKQPSADSTGPSDVYPVGDAVDVYRAVLDLLYVDGHDRPKMIVLWDTAMSHGPGPCPVASCREKWAHKAKIDTTTLLGFARRSSKFPRITAFGYRIPIVLVDGDDFQRIAHDGYAVLADVPPETVGMGDALWAGFGKKYPDAWGYAALSEVGFNRRHTEALISVFQVCGKECRSNEIIFLKRFGNQWRVIERIPDYVEYMGATRDRPYRGPLGAKGTRAQIVALNASGRQPRPEGDDAKKVYDVVLDKLYSFYGESPRRLVVIDQHLWSAGDLPKHRSRVDASTLATYKVVSQINDALSRFSYRVPIAWVSDTALKLLPVQHPTLANRPAMTAEPEQSPLWEAFRAEFPGAWGYASLGRVAFNPTHTQALVSTRHSCGTECFTADTWFLRRKGERWHVAERIPRDSSAGFHLEGLRDLGPGARRKEQ